MRIEQQSIFKKIERLQYKWEVNFSEMPDEISELIDYYFRSHNWNSLDVKSRKSLVLSLDRELKESEYWFGYVRNTKDLEKRLSIECKNLQINEESMPDTAETQAARLNSIEILKEKIAKLREEKKAMDEEAEKFVIKNYIDSLENRVQNSAAEYYRLQAKKGDISKPQAASIIAKSLDNAQATVKNHLEGLPSRTALIQERFGKEYKQSER